MMALPWFRFYSEWDSDPKVQIMPEVMQRRLAMLFCMRCKSDGPVTFHETEAAFHWRISLAELAETKALFMQQGFIDEQWNLVNWDNRQFVSDSSTDRVRRYRERLETSQKRNSNSAVTAQDTDTDSEQIQKRTKKCAEINSAPALFEGKLLTLPTVTGDEWPVFASDCVKWAQAYPGVNVLTELLKAGTWLEANPRNRKTAGGMRRFIVGWMGRAQNNSRPTGSGNGFGNRGQQRTDGNVEAARRAAAAIGGGHSDRPGRGAPGGGERQDVGAVCVQPF